MLVFLWYVSVIIISFTFVSLSIIYFLKIRFEIKSMQINNQNGELKMMISLTISGILLKGIRIFKIEMDTKKIKRYLNKDNFKKIYLKTMESKKIDLDSISLTRKYLKKYKLQFKEYPIEINNTKIYLELGALNVEVTTGLVIVISTLLAMIMQISNNEIIKKYTILGEYSSNKMVSINLVLESIVTINLKHIINILIKFKIWSVRKNGRKSSDRRINEYCN